MSTDSAESYLRRFAEAQLRRLAAGEGSAADCVARVDAVAAAFEGAGLLDGERAGAVAADLDIAFAARSPERGTPLHAGRRAPISALRGEAGFARIFARPGSGGGVTPGDAAGDVVVVPAGVVLRDDEVGEDIYLLSYVASAGRAWLNVAARTAEPRGSRGRAMAQPARAAGAPRMAPPRMAPQAARGAGSPRTLSAAARVAGPLPGRPAPPGGTTTPPNPTGRRHETFAGSVITAVDDGGREYALRFSGGGGHWYLGRLSVHPAPPPGVSWLEVRRGGQAARIDLTAAPPEAGVTTHTVASGPGEAYLLRRAEALLGHAAATGAPAALATAEVTGLASAVPALRAVGALPEDSPVPGQFAALAERMGAPGHLIAAPGELPERWASVLEAGLAGAPGTNGGGGGEGDVEAASLGAVLPEADGVAVHLAGLVTLPDRGTLIFGGLRAWSAEGGQSLWLRDEAGGWHAVSVTGWSGNGNSYTFQASVVPPVRRGGGTLSGETPVAGTEDGETPGEGTRAGAENVTSMEFCVTGATTEIRAAISLSWWTP